MIDIQKEIDNLIKEALKNLGIETETITLEHPADLAMGDYSTNVAMAHAKKLGMNPKELAEKIVELLLPLVKGEVGRGYFSHIEVAGPGFINFYLSREFFAESIQEILHKKENWGRNNILTGKKVMVEYTQPNPFKPFHIGHLMSNAIGESISRIVEFSGAHTIRANYQGDVGLHVARAFYGMQKKGMPEDMSVPVSALAAYIGDAYVLGSKASETDPEAKQEIDILNKKIYDKSDREVNEVYDWGRKVSLEAFEEIYKLLGTKFDYYFFESDMTPIGLKIVKENIPEIFEESEDAIVFKAEKYDPKLHTRVFITSLGIPLYDTKELGLTVTKFEKEPDLELSIVVTAIEQGEYMKVVQKAISILHSELEKKMKHVTHGMMRLESGKMSSRKGNVITGESMINDSMDLVLEKVADRDLNETEKVAISKIVGVGALKYSILRSSIGSDIMYNEEKSLSFEGDSGPYLQYTAVRASSIIKKAETENIVIDFMNVPEDVTTLEKLLYQFPEIVKHSYELLEPHHITTYLTELASAFNSFYANTIVLNKDDMSSGYRVAIVEAFYQTMKNGLYVLGIQTPEKM